MNTSTQPRRAWPVNALDDCGHIDCEARRLRDLAASFSHVGNDIVADMLREIAVELFHRTNLIRNDIGDAVNQRFKDSMESSGNLLSAVFAGAAMRRAEISEEKS
jgi:hypothetical protein